MMKVAGQIFACLALAAIGYAVGLQFAKGSASREPASQVPDTQLKEAERSSKAVSNGTFAEVNGDQLRDPRTGATFSESRERLEALANSILAPRRGAAFYVEGKRPGEAQLEIERIFALASRSQVLEFFAESVDESTHEALLEAAFARLAEFSVSEALAIWKEQRSRDGKSAGIAAIVRAWSHTEPHEAERWIDGLQETRDRQAALFAYLDEMVESSPALVRQRLFEIEEFWPSLHLSKRLVSQLEPAEFPALADRFLSQKKGKWQYQNQVADLLTEWGKRDRGAMLQWLLKHPEGELLDHVVSRVTGSFSKEDPAKLLQEIGPHLSDNRAFSEMAGQAWLRWLADGEDATEAVAWFSSHGEHITASWDGVRHGFREWSGEDTIQVIDQVLDLPEGDSRQQIVGMLLHRLSDADPKSALTYGKEHLPDGSNTNDFLAGALSQYVRKGEDPEWALDWATENFQNPEAQNQAVRWVMSAWAEHDPKAAAQRAAKLTGKLREEAFSGIVYDWAEKDPDQLLEFVKSPPDQETAPYLARNSFWNFAYERGGEEYLDEALSMPAGEVRENAVRGLFAGWSRANLETSAVALDQMKTGPLRDAAISEFVNVAGWEDREAALTWSLAISNPEERKKSALAQAKRWLQADRKIAARWIELNGEIPSTWKAELLKRGE